MDLHRKAYSRLLQWKEQSNGTSAMLIEGARRVGKSYLARRFAEQEYTSYLYLDFSNIEKEVLDLFENEMNPLDIFFLKLQSFYAVNLKERKSCIIFDEVQMYPRARQMIKHLVADGRYDYIETGSLVNIKQNVQNILIPSEEESMQLNPLDFEEFLFALNEEMLVQYIQTCFTNRRPLGDALHRKAMNLFRVYMIVGGMPQAVEKYCETKNLIDVNYIKQRILKLYRDDIAKFAKGYEAKVLSIFDQIPEQLTKHEKKFSLASLGKTARYREYEDSFIWLSESKVVNHCYNSTDPNVGINLNTDRLTMKCYMADTGLLITQAIDDGTVIQEEVLKAIMFDKVGINEGMFLENVVSQLLVAAGHKLFFYSRTDKNDFHNNIEIDFLIRKKKKISIVEVKSGEYRKHTSLDRFSQKFSDKVGDKYIIYTKDLKKEEDIVCIPAYMVYYL
ncbi:MAG: ATP-binding protein [Lachnospiraceae bacterium]|nr:ATP-binding protein [Lachnospiraceae bacterium]